VEAPEEVIEASGPAVTRVLVDNHRAFLRFLERHVESRAAAEDILQHAFARALEKVEELREDEAAVAWFYRVLRNAIVDHYRRRAAEGRALSGLAQELEGNQPAPALQAEACQCVLRLAETLKPEYRDALRRIEVEGASVKSFAEERGISASNAGVRIFRAREALRRQVAVSCGTCAEHGCFACTCGAGPGSARSV
jgi:RNA polymerase sigma factor (sigma-70 family)